MYIHGDPVQIDTPSIHACTSAKGVDKAREQCARGHHACAAHAGMRVRPSGRASAARIPPERALSPKMQMVHGPETLKRLAGPSSVAEVKDSKVGGAAARRSRTPCCLVRTAHLRVQNICLCLLHSAQETACACSCKCLCAARTGSCMRRKAAQT
eukprot:5217239-Pleurochrysis_carterae.AAC.1